MILFLPLLVGISSLFLSGDLRRAPASPFQPPPIVFSTVWPALYLLMGYAGHRVEKTTGGDIPTAFFAQLFLNFTWSIVYTRIGSLAALVNMIFLIVAAAIATNQFYKIDKTSAYLLVPYLAWLSFAAFLNTDVVLANRAPSLPTI